MNPARKTDEFGLNIESLLLLIKRKFRWFAVFGMLGLVAGGMYAFLQKTRYESRLTFALDEGSSNGSNLSMLASQFGFGANLGENGLFSGDNILEVMRSKRIFDGVMLAVDTFGNKRMTLMERYLETSGMKKKLGVSGKTIFEATNDSMRLSFFQDSLLNEIYIDWKKNHLKASKPDRKFSIYEVNITLPDEKLAKVATDKVIEETMEFYTEIKTAKSKSILKILEDRVASMKGNFTTSLESLAFSKDANINPALVQTTVPAMKEQTNIQVFAGAYGELFKNLEIARFQYLKETPLLQIIDQPRYPLKEVKLSPLKGGLIGAVAAVILMFMFLLGLEFYRKK